VVNPDFHCEAEKLGAHAKTGLHQDLNLVFETVSTEASPLSIPEVIRKKLTLELSGRSKSEPIALKLQLAIMKEVKLTEYSQLMFRCDWSKDPYTPNGPTLTSNAPNYLWSMFVKTVRFFRHKLPPARPLAVGEESRYSVSVPTHKSAPWLNT
jgi:hypothetical protein